MTANCLIIGLSALGTRLARELSRLGAAVAVVDRDQKSVDRIKRVVDVAICGDVMQKEALEKLGPMNRTHVVVAIDHDFEAAQMASFHLLEMEVSRLIVVANTDERCEILSTIGVTEIVTPGLIQAKSLAVEIMSDQIHIYRPVTKDQGVAEVILTREICLDDRLGEKLASARYRIVGYLSGSREESSTFNIDLSSPVELAEGDRVLVFGPSRGIVDVVRKRF